MKLRKIFIFCVLAAAFFGFIYTLTYDIDGLKGKPDFVQVSMIVREADSALYESIRQGMDQAANDMRAEVSFVLLSRANDIEEQKAMIDREIKNGAEALIISAADSALMTEAIERAAEVVPVIAINTPTGASDVKAYFTIDNYQAGKAIGREAAKRLISGERAVLLSSSSGCDDIRERTHGILDSFDFMEKEIILIEMQIDTEEGSQQLSALLAEEKMAVVPDTALLVKAASVLNGQMKGGEEEPGCQLYGIGVSGKITSYLQKGVIDAIVAQNGFNIGYLSVNAAVEAVHKKGPESNTKIEFLVANEDNMYSTKSQRMLFPFSK